MCSFWCHVWRASLEELSRTDSTQALRWLSDYKDFLLSENKWFPVTPGELNLPVSREGSSVSTQSAVSAE